MCTALHSSCIESRIDREFIGGHRCGDVFISIDEKFLTLHCIFCEFQNKKMNIFLNHLRNEHLNILAAGTPVLNSEDNDNVEIKIETLEAEETKIADDKSDHLRSENSNILAAGTLWLNCEDNDVEIKKEILEAEETKIADDKRDLPNIGTAIEDDPLLTGENFDDSDENEQFDLDSTSRDENDDDSDYNPQKSITINEENASFSTETCEETKIENRIKDVNVSRLIELVQGHPMLWNTEIRFERRKYKEAIEDIVKKMVEEFPKINIDYQYVRKKLNKLKRLYYNFNKKGQKHTRNEQICYQKLHFLKGHEPLKGVDKKKEMECPLCFIVFKNLRDHMNRCHQEGDTRQACTLCDQILPSQRKLKMHLRSSHRRFECEHCSAVYASLRSIKIHMQRDHTDKPQLPIHGLEQGSVDNVCEYCGKKFNFRQCLRNHIKTVHLQLRPYVCTVCSKSYKAKAKLKSHMNSVHLNIRPFVCDVCNRAFYDRKTMMQHKRIHSNVKNYVCKLCGSAFRQASSLNSHMKTHPAMLDFQAST